MRGKQPTWPKVGDVVDYHSVIGEEVTQAGMVVRHGLQRLGDPECGPWVVWLEGKAGCVVVEALTPPTGEGLDV